MSKLTRSKIAKASADAQVDFCLDKQPTYEVALARRIEVAATEPLLQRIAELERQLEEAHKALHDAATSLNTISELAGYPKKGGVETFMDTFLDVRLYARSRHQVARDAINAYYLQPHVKKAHEAIRAAMQKGKS